jgi:hypothetical protein
VKLTSHLQLVPRSRKRGSIHPLPHTHSDEKLARTGPEPACDISIGVAKKAVRDWTKRNNKKHWESTTGLKQAKGLILGPSVKRTKDLLN